MGPLTLADFIGLDTCLAIMQVLHTELGNMGQGQGQGQEVARVMSHSVRNAYE